MNLVLTLYVLLFVSVIFNLLLLVRVKYLQEEVSQVRGGVDLSREELEQLKSRVSQFKEKG